MTRGEVWLAQVGRETRPVVILTRTAVIDVRQLVTVAEVTTQVRSIAAEVTVDHTAAGLDRSSVVNCDGIYTVPRSTLTRQIGSLDDSTMDDLCTAVGYAIGC